MADKILSYKDIETIAISRLVSESFVVTNTGLSPELIKELSADISSDYIIELIRIQLSGVWYTYSNDPTIYAGTTEEGTPVYKTEWNGEDWLYLPFNITLNSVKNSGEIVGGSIEIQNFDKKIIQEIDKTNQGIPIKVYAVSKKTMHCIFKDEHKYITKPLNTGLTIQADFSPANVLSNPCPSGIYKPSQFRK